MKRIISIIGSGIGGLAAGCRLAMLGHQVTIYEKNALPGGKAAGTEIEGVWLDSAPTILRMPHLLEDLFSQAPAQIRNQIQLKQLDTHYRFYSHQGAQFFEISRNKAATIDSIQNISKEDAEQYNPYLTRSQTFYQHSLRTVPEPQQSGFKKRLGAIFHASPPRSPFGQSLHQFSGQFFSTPLIQSSFSFYPLNFGQNPLSVPEQTAMVHAIEQQWGIAYPSGGMRNLVLQLAEYFHYLGGKLVFNTAVTHIPIQSNQVNRIRLQDGSLAQTDVVVSNLTPYQTMRKLPDNLSRFPTRPRNFGNSYFLLHCITQRLPGREHLQTHSILNPQDFQKTMQQIFKQKRLPESPWIYLHLPGRADPAQLPAGLDAVIALCPVPNLTALPGDQSYLHKFRTLILKSIDTIIPGFERLILHEKITTPTNFQDIYTMELGTNYQPIKPPQIEGLFYVGESSWQSLGLIGAITAAEEIANRIGK